RQSADLTRTWISGKFTQKLLLFFTIFYLFLHKFSSHTIHHFYPTLYQLPINKTNSSRLRKATLCQRIKTKPNIL
ncbi:hypothetical protein BpHYR1_039701, partial [Brachionus plicatilis]